MSEEDEPISKPDTVVIWQVKVDRRLDKQFRDAFPMQGAPRWFVGQWIQATLRELADMPKDAVQRAVRIHMKRDLWVPRREGDIQR